MGMRGDNFGGGVVLGDVGPAIVWMDMDGRDMIIGHSTQLFPPGVPESQTLAWGFSANTW